MKIREMNIGDKTAFLKMCGDFFNSPAVLHGVPDEFIEKNFNAIVSDSPFAIGYIFEDEKNHDQIMGYSFLTKCHSTEVGGLCLWIEELYILEQYRSQGIGREFIAFLEEEYKGKVERIRMEVEPSNVRAMELYERLGFEKLSYVQLIKDF